MSHSLKSTASNAKPTRRRGKASQPNAPRQPARARGLARYDALVDATEALLQTENPDDVGLYDIAERAGIPPASAYHFFPTKEAAYTALAIRCMKELIAVHDEPIPARRIADWQGLFRVDIERARAFYNANTAALKIFYGGYGGVDARNVDRLTASSLSSENYPRMDRIYHMPYLSEPHRRFGTRLAILDAIWAQSVQSVGWISDEHFEESFVACIAYSKTFLPERIEQRDSLKKAIEADATIWLPFRSAPKESEAESGEG